MQPLLASLLVAIGGWCNLGTRLRWPYNSIDAGDAEEIRKIAVRMIPEFIKTETA